MVKKNKGGHITPRKNIQIPERDFNEFLEVVKLLSHKTGVDLKYNQVFLKMTRAMKEQLKTDNARVVMRSRPHNFFASASKNMMEAI